MNGYIKREFCSERTLWDIHTGFNKVKLVASYKLLIKFELGLWIIVPHLLHSLKHMMF